MKLLVRTITLGAIFVYMVTMILNSTIVETTKYELDVAATNSLYHTIDTYEKNRELISKNQTDNLYFTTDQEYYNYFLDDLTVQLNGRLKLDIVQNYINVDTGAMDLDITVTYKGLDSKNRTYTTNITTDGRITEPEETYISKEIAKIPLGSKVRWNDKIWYVAKNEGKNIALIYSESISISTYGNTVRYETSNVAKQIESWVVDNLNAISQNEMAEETLSGLQTLSGLYIENGNDTYIGKYYVLSEAEALAFNERLGLSNNVFNYSTWTRTASASSKVKVATNTGINSADVSSTYNIYPVVSLSREKIQTLDTETDSENKIIYVFDKNITDGTQNGKDSKVENGGID